MSEWLQKLWRWWGKYRKKGAVAVALLLLALALYPITKVTEADVLSATQLFMLVTLACNWNLIGGITGYADFGHAVFFGIGGYFMGILVTKAPIVFAPGLSFWLALPIASLAGALLAMLIGWATLRLKGPYFSIAMLGTFLAVREVVRLLGSFTGGGNGLDLPSVLNQMGNYYFMLAVMGMVITLTWLIRRSQFGFSLIAIREDEIGAEMRGINTALHKIIAFALAAFFTSVCGAFWALQNTYIDPDIIFQENRTLEMVVASILGGLGTVWGPPIGAVVFYVLKNTLWSNLLDYHPLALGMLLILLVMLLPEGILGIRYWGKRRMNR